MSVTLFLSEIFRRELIVEPGDSGKRPGVYSYRSDPSQLSEAENKLSLSKSLPKLP